MKKHSVVQFNNITVKCKLTKHQMVSSTYKPYRWPYIGFRATIQTFEVLTLVIVL